MDANTTRVGSGLISDRLANAVRDVTRADGVAAVSGVPGDRLARDRIAAIVGCIRNHCNVRAVIRRRVLDANRLA